MINNQYNRSNQPSWKEVLSDELQKPYFNDLEIFIAEQRKLNIIYPPNNLVFNAFNRTPFDTIKVVILGQDPYHGYKQAHGLCFSVPEGIKPPPSLKNIFKELKQDIGFEIPTHGNLENWANQGVLLLNTTLTVKANEPLSHANKGWETFTDKAIEILSHKKERLVFLLWGKNAQAKEPLINTSKHFILKAAHPSPFSAYRGFFGCKHFSKTNEILEKMKVEKINWKL